MHTHDFLEIFLILEGQGWHHINHKKVALKAGDLAFIRVRDRHGFTARADERMRLMNVAFTPAWFSNFRKLLPDSSQIAKWLNSPLPSSVRLPDPVREAMDRRGLDLLLAQSPRQIGLAQFCLEAFRLLAEPSEASLQTEVPEWLAHGIAAMDLPQNLLHDLDYFQHLAGRSPEHFARLSRVHFGVPPRELLNRARVRYAQRRLLESDAKVIDVAYDCGFKNLGYFHRTFLRLSGFTPRAWRLKNFAATVPR